MPILDITVHSFKVQLFQNVQHFQPTQPAQPAQPAHISKDARHA